MTTLLNTSAPTLAAFLKQETQGLHRQLDGNPLVQALAKHRLEEDAYLHLLTAFLHSYATIENTLSQCQPHAQMTPGYSSRLPVLQNIVGTFSGARAAASRDDSTAESLLPRLTLNTASYWGLRYVVDGSCHGARILLPRLTVQWGADHPSLNYWRALAEQAPLWPEVTARLNTLPADAITQSDCVAAARWAFQVFIAQVDQHASFVHDTECPTEIWDAAGATLTGNNSHCGRRPPES